MPSSSEEAVVGIRMTGTLKEVLFRVQTDVATMTRRGGQSSNRLARIRMEKKDLLVDKISTLVVTHCKTSINLFIGGYGSLYQLVAERVGNNKSSSNNFSNLHVLNSTSLDDLMKQSQSILHQNEIQLEKQMIQEIEEHIRTNPDRCLFGKEEVAKAFEDGTLMKLYCSKEMNPSGIQDDKITTIELQYLDTFLVGYGNMIGIKWY